MVSPAEPPTPSLEVAYTDLGNSKVYLCKIDPTIFVSWVYGRFEPSGGTLRLGSCRHPQGYLTARLDMPAVILNRG